MRIVCDRKTGFNKGYGFVTFATTFARNAFLKKGTVDYIKMEEAEVHKAVKKEASSRKLVIITKSSCYGPADSVGSSGK